MMRKGTDTTQENKMRERLQITRFIELLGYKESDISYPESDPPDAYVQSENGQISLEHTRIIQKEERPIETIRENCIRRAKAQWTDSARPTLSVNILFNSSSLVSYKQINKYSDLIVNAIYNFVGPLQHTKSRIHSKEITCYVSLCPLASADHWTCVNNHIGWVKLISESRLRDTILKKSGAIQRYRHKEHETWLLLFVESEYASSMFSFETHYNHESDFDRVFISNGHQYKELVKRQTQNN